MYITPAPCGSVAQGDRHQAAADLHEVVYLLEVLRVLLDQLLRQIGEVWCYTKKVDSKKRKMV